MSQPRVISAVDTFFAKVVVSASFLFGMAWLVIGVARQLVHSDLPRPSIPQIALDLAFIAFGAQVVVKFSGIGLFPPKPHPIVAELRAAVAAAKRG